MELAACFGMVVGVVVVSLGVDRGLALGYIFVSGASFSPLHADGGVALVVSAEMEVAPGISVVFLGP